MNTYPKSAEEEIELLQLEGNYVRKDGVIIRAFMDGSKRMLINFLTPENIVIKVLEVKFK